MSPLKINGALLSYLSSNYSIPISPSLISTTIISQPLLPATPGWSPRISYKKAHRLQISAMNTHPSLTESHINDTILPELVQWSLSHGLTIYPPNFNLASPVNAPTTIFPTPLSSKAFQDAHDVQQIYNKLYAILSQDPGHWLSDETEKLAAFDADFTGKLWALYKRAQEQGIKQTKALGLFRSDYLVEDSQIKQVEFNTVSVSFGGLSTKVGELHRYLNKAGLYSDTRAEFYAEKNLPVSESSRLLALGLAEGVRAYAESESQQGIVAFIVQQGERNVFDQKVLEHNLLDLGVRSVRLTIQEIHQTTSEVNGKLILNATGEEIAVVYFRAGYAPTDFQCEQDWENRLFLECSSAIKAPNLMTQLSGTKKIQQLLTNKDLLTQFLSPKEVEILWPTFVKIYPMDSGSEGRKLAFERPQDFVLKPQREGGGNNIYKEDIPEFLNNLDENEWSGYILMELIKPETVENKIVREDKIYTDKIISELGIFGYVLFDEKEILVNETAGWLLRSKFSSSNEGGVAAGFGCVDSVILV